MSFGKVAKQEVKSEEKKGNPPIHTERAGAVKADIWENKSQDGKSTFNTVTIQRSYKDKQDQWQTTTSFRINDLPKLILVLQKAYERGVMSEKDTE